MPAYLCTPGQAAVLPRADPPHRAAGVLLLSQTLRAHEFRQNGISLLVEA